MSGLSHSRTETAVCAVSGERRPRRELVALGTLRPALAERIRVDHPELGNEALVSRGVLDGYVLAQVETLIAAERGELSELDRQVTASLAANELVSTNVEASFEGQRTLGERASDGLAAFGGSWGFVFFFFLTLAAWIAANALAGAAAFDAYPFILLNLVLSCLAAIQAPIIMMSQRRQEEKDRARSLNDYRVNLKAELEIRHLHEKMDHLIARQWQRLAEIQELQMELIQNLKR